MLTACEATTCRAWASAAPVVPLTRATTNADARRNLPYLLTLTSPSRRMLPTARCFSNAGIIYCRRSGAGPEYELTHERRFARRWGRRALVRPFPLGAGAANQPLHLRLQARREVLRAAARAPWR